MADAEGGPTQAEYALVILSGDFEGTRHILRNDETTGSYTIEDLQSTNGTKVNGKRVRSAPLSDGDEIQIGHTRFLFRIGRRRSTDSA